MSINNFLFLVFFFVLPSLVSSQNPYEGKNAPKLVIGIVVDQMRYDYIYRFWSKFNNEGFKRLVTKGYFCKNTTYNYVPTYTGPGHASIYTGTTPSVNGIIANEWYVRKHNKSIYCVEDSLVKTFSAKDSSGLSPRNLLVTTITDELRLSNNLKSKVIGISLKDRGAILPAGHLANAVYWYDGSSGDWTSSSYYMKELPDWINQFNNKDLPQKYLNQNWTTLLPIEQYIESTADDVVYENPFTTEVKPIFPHALPVLHQNNYDLIRSTPFGNALTKDFAIEAIKSEKLGEDNHTDFISISFSSTDYIGHRFGPNSIEIEDTYLRLDRDLAELLEFLDSRIGKDDYLIFLTSDHGASYNPTHNKDLKIPGGLFKFPMDSLKNFLNTVFGKEEWILNYSNQQIYLNTDLIRTRKINISEMQDQIVSFLLQKDGIAHVITDKSFQECASSEKELKNLVANGFYPKRSGDIIIILEPSWMEWKTKGTTHGAPYNYDTHIPLLWYGWKIPKGSTTIPTNITDIAPTLSFILNINLPSGATGRVINFNK